MAERAEDKPAGMQEETMGGWIAVFEDEVEGRLVTVKVYGSDHDEDGDDCLPMRAMVTPIDGYEDGPEQGEDGQALVATTKAAASLITFEPDTLEDLEESLIEIGFSPKAAAWIIDKVSE
jgi:hypothetical protein